MSKKLIIITGALLVAIFLAALFYSWWYRANVGDLRVQSIQDSVVFSIDNKKDKYQGNQVITKLPSGKHLLHARSDKPNYYKPQEIEFTVEKNKTTQVEIKLEPIPGKNPNVSGAEYGF